MRYPSSVISSRTLWDILLFPLVFLSFILTDSTESAEAGNTHPNTAFKHSHSTLIIGHQGAAGLAPGNTLAGVSLAIDLGIDAIELDVMLSADAKLVVHHDFRLNAERTRTEQGKWLVDSELIPINTMTVDQLQSYDVGRLKPGSRSARRFSDQVPVDGQRIPTLEEVFGVIAKTGPDGPDLFLEIKTSPEESDVSPSPLVMADKVVQLIDEHDLAKRCKILSFDWRALSRVNQIAPYIATVYLTSRLKQLKVFDNKTTLLWTAGIDPADHGRSMSEMIKASGGKYWGAKHSEIWQSHVDEAHEADLKVYVWTVDSESDMRRFVDIGIDGIITNRPDLLKKVVANKQ